MTPSDDDFSELDADDAAAVPTVTVKAPALDQTKKKRFADAVSQLDASWLKEPPKPRKFLVTYQDEADAEGSDEDRQRRKRAVLSRGVLHTLGGEGGAGKGRFAVQLGLCLAAGRARGTTTPTWASKLGLDIHAVEGGEKVLFLLGEDDAHEVHARAYGATLVEGFDEDQRQNIARNVKWRSFHGEPFALVKDQFGSADDEVSADMQDLLAYLEKEGPFALVVVDPQARFLRVEENSNEAMHHAMACMERITTTNGNPALIVSAHTRKPSKDNGGPTQHDVRGGSSVVNAGRCTLLLDPQTEAIEVDEFGRKSGDQGYDAGTALKITERTVKLVNVKNNLTAKGEDVTLAFHIDGGLLVEDQETRRRRRVRQRKNGRPVDSKAKPNGAPATAKPNGKPKRAETDAERAERYEREANE